MTSTSDEDVLHSRGKTLTPESPRPLHLSQPASIPVLQNQMDPAFNDTSIHQTAQEKPLCLDPEIRDQIRLARKFSSQAYPLLGVEDGDWGSDGHDTAGYSASLETGAGGGQIKGNGLPLPAGQNVALSNQIPSSVLGPSPHHTTVNPDHSFTAPTSALTSEPTFHLDSSASLLAPLWDKTIAHPKDTGSPNYAPAADEGSHENMELEGAGTSNTVNYQTTYNTLPSSTSTAPSVAATAATSTATNGLHAETTFTPSVELPPRPPQDNVSTQVQYAAGDGTQSHFAMNNHTTSGLPENPQSNNEQPKGPPSGAQVAPGTSSAINDLPPPPVATFQRQPALDSKVSTNKADRYENKISDWLEEAPWPPDVQKKYDEFLTNERVYVTEGVWDRFPAGARLFVGNLPTEKVTKRDLFHLFHKYGKLAQISIKQAYGFVQFLESHACSKALQAEQGGILRGRKIHLEISKPQRNTRAPLPESTRIKRSRSPEYTRPTQNARGPRPIDERYERSKEPKRGSFSGFRDRDEPNRRRDDYRPIRSPIRSRSRSPSPRGFRRDGYRSRDRTPERYPRRRDRPRSRSPYGRGGRHRSRSRSRSLSPRSRDRDYGSDSELPIPKRSPHNVPDVQIIVLGDVDRDFVYRIERAFRDRGLKSDVLMLSPRISLSAVVRRQIIEGVSAIVKLSRTHQYTGKIPLQVFDRSGGVDNIRFNEYAELDLNVAAEVVFHARTFQHGAVGNQYPLSRPFPVPPVVPQLSQNLPISPTGGPNVASLISNLDPAALQSLLSALQPNSTAPNLGRNLPASFGGNTNDFTNLITNALRQNNPATVMPMSTLNQPHHPTQPPTGGAPQPNLPLAPDTNLASLLAKGIGGPPQNQNLPQQGPSQAQNIMDLLMKRR